MTIAGPVLVTGGAGFLGRRLVARLAAAGHEVHVLDPASPLAVFPEGVRADAGSILDQDTLARTMAGKGTVFHLAAVATLWARNPGVYERVNHLGTRAVLAAAARARISRVLVTSTALILKSWRDGGPVPVTEAEPRPPLRAMPGPYSRSKWRAEAAVRDAMAEGLNASLLYPTVPIGPPEGAVTEPTEMLKSFLRDPPPAYLETTLNLLDVEDAAAAHILAAQRARPGARYLLAGEDVAFSALLRLLAETSGRAMPRRRIPYALARLAAHAGAPLARLSGRPPAASVEGVRAAARPRPFDASRTCQELEWRPRPAREAVIRTVRAILAQPAAP